MERLEIIANEPRKLVYRPYDDGPTTAGKVAVEVEHAAPKHGTEFTMFRAVSAFVDSRFDKEYQLFIEDEDVKAKPFSMRPGNIWIGRVTEVGEGVTEYKIGDRVTGYGGLRPTILTKAAHIRKMPEGLTWQEAVCFDPAQFALGGIRDGHVRMGDNVAVIGLGAIGQIAAQLAKLAGASKVIVVDPITVRREVALMNGADLSLDPNSCDAGLEIKKATGGRGADVVLETSGYYEGLQQAIRGVAYAGNVAVIGWFKDCHEGLNFGREAHFNQPNLIFSRACSEPNRDYPRWSFDRLCDACWEMITKRMLKCENLIHPIVPFDKAADTYMAIEQDARESVKMGVDF